MNKDNESLLKWNSLGLTIGMDKKGSYNKMVEDEYKEINAKKWFVIKAD